MNKVSPVYRKVFGLLFASLMSLTGYSQISSNNYSYSDTTQYSPADSVFVFCSNHNNARKLIANDSSGVGGYNFEWRKYDTITNNFLSYDKDFYINNDSTQTTISGLPSGGYKVELTKGDTIQKFIAWVFNDTILSINVNVVDPLDCELLELNAQKEYIKSFDYYDIFGTKYELANKDEDHNYNWSSTPETDIRNYNSFYTSTYELPVEDVQYNVVLTDRFGCSVQDSAKGSAPLLVRFNNESVNGYKYTLFFGDTLVNNDIDTVDTDDNNEIFEHTYYYSEEFSGKKYYTKLISESEYGCLDSVNPTVTVEPSEIDVPNVFSPNNDGQGDNIFIIKDKSIRTFKIVIYSRTGNLVHKYDGEISDWEGWNGKVKDRAKASEGVYFYIIEAKGWDDIKYQEKGTVYLFR
jgi:gliding motility-associated-like protein